MRRAPEIRIVGLRGIPEVEPGAPLAQLVLGALRRQKLGLSTGDVLILTSKIVSKAENRLVELKAVAPSELATSFALSDGRDPRAVEVVLREARRVVKMDRGLLLTETKHGLVCAHAGVDSSNVPGLGVVALLPSDPDRSAARLRQSFKRATGARVGVIISDTFGRPWREGFTNVAIGVSGLKPLRDYRGERDPHGRSLKATVIAVADEIASAAELVMGKLDRVPAALLRGYPFRPGPGRARELIRPAEQDHFR